MEWSSVCCVPRPATNRYTSPSIMEFDLPLYKLQSESELSDLTESEDSAQMELTASCEDTPDTESSSLESELSLASSMSSVVSIPELSSGPEDTVENSLFNLSKSGVKTHKCIKCHRDNRNSSLLFCNRCFKERKRFLPPRPKRKRIGQKSMPGTSKAEPSKSSSPQHEMESMSLSLCGCCFERPSNGIFIHGDIGHQIFCYTCCQRVWLERKLCPYCNRMISKVVKLYKVD